MATAEELRRLVANAREADEVVTRYGGARRWLTGIGFYAIDFGTADDPIRRWLEWCRDNPGPCDDGTVQRALDYYLSEGD